MAFLLRRGARTTPTPTGRHSSRPVAGSGTVSTLKTRDDLVATLARRRDWTTGDHASWALVDGAELLGSISVHRIDREQDDGEIGYWIAPSARGRGLAGRGRRGGVPLGVRRYLGLHRIQLFHAVENVASARVAEKARVHLRGAAAPVAPLRRRRAARRAALGPPGHGLTGGDGQRTEWSGFTLHGRRDLLQRPLHGRRSSMTLD